MKRILAVLAALGLLVFGAMAYAHWEGGPGYGHMGQGYGMGPGMMGGYGPGYGQGYGPGWCWGDNERPSKVDTEKRDAFFKESRDLRKKLHDKMFELREAYEADDEKKAEAVEKEIEKLQEEIAKIAEKYGFTAGDTSRGERGRGGYGRHMGPGYGPGMMGPGMMGPGYGPRY